MRSERRQKALEIIAEISERKPEELEPRMDLVADLGIDSPDALRVLMELEEAFGLEISDEEAARMDTVGQILEFLERAPVPS